MIVASPGGHSCWLHTAARSQGLRKKLWTLWSEDGTVLALLTPADSDRAFFIPGCLNCPVYLFCVWKNENVTVLLLALQWLRG